MTGLPRLLDISVTQFMTFPTASDSYCGPQIYTRLSEHTMSKWCVQLLVLDNPYFSILL
jgi:hypothetical protein